MTEPAWHIVHVRGGFEAQAGEDLISKGFTVFVPQYRKEYRHHRTKQWITRYHPLMPAYLFVLASPHWPRLATSDHVVAVMCSQNANVDRTPIRIRDADVQAIRAAQDMGEFDQMRVYGGNVKPGESVKIVDGAFAGIKAVVEEAGLNQLTVMLSLLGREVRATVPLEKLNKAG